MVEETHRVARPIAVGISVQARRAIRMKKKPVRALQEEDRNVDSV